MYKLMIVEDEPLIRAGLLKYFDWKQLSVTTIDQAVNGHDGYSKAIVQRPDIVITDIRMPEMNGLDMIQKLKHKLPDCTFVILSGYQDFSYAQQAIRLGVKDYLLKPLQWEESTEVLRKCIASIRKKTQPSKEQTDAPPRAESSSLREPDNNIFLQIEAFIMQHIDQDITLQMLADHFYYNPTYLSRLFKTKLNQNYIAFITELRINHAKACLRKPQYSISEVGEMCGYKSYKHFVRIFKKTAHLTPSEYRKQLGGVL